MKKEIVLSHILSCLIAAQAWLYAYQSEIGYRRGLGHSICVFTIQVMVCVLSSLGACMAVATGLEEAVPSQEGPSLFRG